MLNLSALKPAASIIPSWLSFTFPQLDNDKTYGLSQATTATIKFDKDVSLDVQGENYFEHNYYQVGGTLKEKIDAACLSEKMGKQLQPKNGHTEDDLSGGLVLDLDLNNSKDKSCEPSSSAHDVTLELAPSMTYLCLGILF